MKIVDALGKACPLPVIETRKALKENNVVTTLVDNVVFGRTGCPAETDYLL